MVRTYGDVLLKLGGVPVAHGGARHDLERVDDEGVVPLHSPGAERQLRERGPLRHRHEVPVDAARPVGPRVEPQPRVALRPDLEGPHDRDGHREQGPPPRVVCVEALHDGVVVALGQPGGVDLEVKRLALRVDHHVLGHVHPAGPASYLDLELEPHLLPVVPFGVPLGGHHHERLHNLVALPRLAHVEPPARLALHLPLGQRDAEAEEGGRAPVVSAVVVKGRPYLKQPRAERLGLDEGDGGGGVLDRAAEAVRGEGEARLPQGRDDERQAPAAVG
mmetsp:Transcript_55063/g.133291  ORF Transcript_55063/g.133291 Transcript_55063/m.133291 type:complete len:276 (+) Transcript_55063:1604-2431(+)